MKIKSCFAILVGILSLENVVAQTSSILNFSNKTVNVIFRSIESVSTVTNSPTTNSLQVVGVLAAPITISNQSYGSAGLRAQIHLPPSTGTVLNNCTTVAVGAKSQSLLLKELKPSFVPSASILAIQGPTSNNTGFIVFNPGDFSNWQVSLSAGSGYHCSNNQ